MQFRSMLDHLPRTAKGITALVVMTAAALVAAALLVAGFRASGAGGARGAPPAPPFELEAGDIDPGPPPSPVALGGGRFKGPDGVVLSIPRGWRLDEGTSEELWATLRPANSQQPMPQIGVGSIPTEGLEEDDASLALDEIFAEILPEITGATHQEGQDKVTIGRGTVAGREIVQVRRVRPAPGRVVITWGLFEPSFKGPEKLVAEISAALKVEA